MDVHGMERLHDEQRKAIQETNQRIAQLDKFKDDYEKLQTRLHTLPDKVTHQIMVPFGSHAFMPGHLIHTNEILVLLGDNWFVERSAKQAEGIVERRIQAIEQQVEELRGQQGLLQPRTEYMQQLHKEQKDVVEIKEEYRPEEEELWKEEHRKRVRAHKQQMKASGGRPGDEEAAEPNDGDEDEELWARFRQLEIQERLGHEYSKIPDFSEGPSSMSKGVQHVRWQDEEPASSASSEDEEEEEEEEEEESDGEETDSDDEESDTAIAAPRCSSTIKFTHSAVPGPPRGAPDEVIQSPADVYRLIKPKSILKTPTAVTTSSDFTSTQKQEHTQHSTQMPQAFSEEVRERPAPQPSMPSSSHPPADGSRKISRFKQQQMKKTAR